MQGSYLPKQPQEHGMYSQELTCRLQILRLSAKYYWTRGRVFLFLFEAATKLARRVQPKRTQVVCSNKVGRSRLAQRHSCNGPWNYLHSFDVYIHTYFFEVHIRIRRHTNNRGREQNTNEQ